MAKIYIPQPTIDEVVYSFLNHMSKLYRCRITYTITHKNGDFDTVDIGDPDIQHKERSDVEEFLEPALNFAKNQMEKNSRGG